MCDLVESMSSFLVSLGVHCRRDTPTICRQSYEVNNGKPCKQRSFGIATQPQSVHERCSIVQYVDLAPVERRCREIRPPQAIDLTAHSIRARDCGVIFHDHVERRTDE